MLLLVGNPLTLFRDSDPFAHLLTVPVPAKWLRKRVRAGVPYLVLIWIYGRRFISAAWPMRHLLSPNTTHRRHCAYF